MKVTLYVPNRTKDGEKIEDSVIDELINRIVQCTGGLTIENVTGYYVTKDNKVIREETKLVWTFVDSVDDQEAVVGEFERWGKLANQESLLYELDGQPLFVSLDEDDGDDEGD